MPRHAFFAATIVLAAVAFAGTAAAEPDLETVRELRAVAFKHAQASYDALAKFHHRAAKCESESCVRGCLNKYNKFEGESCLGLEPNEPVFSGDPFDQSSNFTFNANPGTVFPNLGSGVTNDALDEFCPCGGVISSFMRTGVSAAQCLGADLEGGSESGSEGPTVDQILDAFDALIQFACIKNGDDYCQVLAEGEADLEGLGSGSGDSDGSSDVSEETCDDLTAFGCCTASYVEIFQSSELRAIVGEDLDSGVDEINAVLAACGLGEVEPCLKPGETATYTKATITLQANFSELSDPTTLQNFKVAFAKDLANGLNISPLKVEILDVRAGSVVVDSRVRGDITAQLNTALAAGIPLNNTRTAVAAYANVTDVDSDDASVQTEQVTNDADTAPAPAFGPASSLVLLLAAALAAFFL